MFLGMGGTSRPRKAPLRLTKASPMPASSRASKAGVVAPVRPTSTTSETRLKGTRSSTSSSLVTNRRLYSFSMRAPCSVTYNVAIIQSKSPQS